MPFGIQLSWYAPLYKKKQKSHCILSPLLRFNNSADCLLVCISAIGSDFPPSALQILAFECSIWKGAAAQGLISKQ